MIEIEKTVLDEVLLVKPKKFLDYRGVFSVIYNKDIYFKAGIKSDFIQDNYATNFKKGTLRGLHYQLFPHAQAKLVQVIKGSVFDVAVDLRQDSPNFLKWIGVELSEENGYQLFIPEGFGHGYLALEDNTCFQYKVAGAFHPASERSLCYNDPAVGIIWPNIEQEFILSPKDLKAPKLKDAQTF